MTFPRSCWSLFALVLFCTGTFLASTAGAASTSWSTLQGDAGHSGYVPRSYSSTGFLPLWNAMLPSTGSKLVAGDDRIYISQGLTLRAYDAATGIEKWAKSAPVNSTGLSAPTIGNGKIYVDSFGHSSTSGSTAKPQMLGFDATTGTPLFATPHSGQWSAGGQPAVAGNRVFAAGGYYGGLNAYHANTGANLWFQNMPQQYGWTPAVDDVNLYIYFGWGASSPGPSVATLFAIDQATGQIAYTIQDNASGTNFGVPPLTLSPAGFGYVTTAGSLVQFNLNSRAPGWRRSGYTSSLAVTPDGMLVAAAGSQVDVIDELSGDVLWSWASPDGQDVVYNSVITDSHLFVSTQWNVYAVDRITRSVDWQMSQGGHLAIADDRLIVSSPNSIQVVQLASSGMTIESVDVPVGADSVDDRSNNGLGLVEGSSLLELQRLASFAIDRRGILNFDVGALPASFDVLQATLLLDVKSFTVSASAISDLTIKSLAPGWAEQVLGESQQLDELGLVAITLDADLIQQLLAQSSNLQFGVEVQEGISVALTSSEGAAAGGGQAPRLLIRYASAVPEPTAAAMLLCGTLALAVARRRTPRP